MVISGLPFGTDLGTQPAPHGEGTISAAGQVLSPSRAPSKLVNQFSEKPGCSCPEYFSGPCCSGAHALRTAPTRARSGASNRLINGYPAFTSPCTSPTYCRGSPDLEGPIMSQ